VQEELADDGALVGQTALEVDDVGVAALPHVLETSPFTRTVSTSS
jgi:hypothetical protein